MADLTFLKFCFPLEAQELDVSVQVRSILNLIRSTNGVFDWKSTIFQQLINQPKINQIDPNLVKVMVCLTLDYPSTSPINKIALKVLLSDKITFKTQFSQIFFQYYKNTLPNACEFSFITLIKSFNQTLDNIRNILQNLSHVEFDWEMLKWVNQIGQIISEMMKNNSELSSQSEIFALLSSFFHRQFILVKLILINLEINKDQLQECKILVNSYCERILVTLNLPYPVGVVVEGSFVFIRLVFLLGNDQSQYLSTLIQYLNEYIDHLNPRIITSLISSFLLQSNRSLSLLEYQFLFFNSTNLKELIFNLVDLWLTKTDTEFVYFTSMLYLNLTKFILESISNCNEIHLYTKMIKFIVKEIFSFVQTYWSFSNIEHLFESLSNCIRIMETIQTETEFHTFLENDIYHHFINCKNFSSIYRLITLIHQSVEPRHFSTVFGNEIVMQHTIQSSIENFLFHQNDKTEKLFSLTTYQVSNRNIVLVCFISIRFDLMSTSEAKLEQLKFEIEELVFNSGQQLISSFMFNVILPKMFQMKLCDNTLHLLLQHLVKQEKIYSLDPDMIFSLIRLNRQYDLKLLEDETLFLQTFIDQLTDFEDDQVRLRILSLMNLRQSLMIRSNHLLEMVHPNEALTGAVLCKMVNQIDQIDHCETLIRLLDEMETRKKAIKIDLMASVNSLPIYPILLAMRIIICDENFSFESQQAKSFITKLTNQCIEACKLFEPIVCNDSPEGHLPLEEFNRLNDRGESLRKLYVRSQMLLLNGWMTVKESVNILSNVVAMFPNHDLNDNLIQCDQARYVIDFIYQSQLTLVHRGAFEQCSYAFNRLISAIWKHNCPICSSRFQEIIIEIQSCLNGKQVNGFKGQSITRRSGGLPLVMQSILSAEPKTLSGNSLGHEFIRSLIGILDLENENVFESWQVIHSLNILKSLVHDSRLFDLMTIWIESILKLSIRWLERNATYGRMAYSIQNSSSMLFTAIVIRIFGVRRSSSQSDHHQQNRMSSLVFFQMFPTLFSFLYERIENIDKLHNFSSAYSSLIILSHLVPSINEKNVFDICRFLNPLRIMILQCRDLRLRSKAVQVFGQLLSKTNYEEQLEWLSTQIDHNCKLLMWNQLHGTGLLLSELTLLSSKMESTQFNNIYRQIGKLFQFDLYWKIPCVVLQPFHLVHCRIYPFTIDDHRALLIDLATSQPKNIHQIGFDHCSVNLFLDTLIHCIPLDINEFLACAQQLSEQNHNPNGRLLLWTLLNDILDSNGTNKLLRRLQRDTVFDGQIMELLDSFKRLNKNGQLKLNAIMINETISSFIVKSEEWSILSQSNMKQNDLYLLTNVQFDLLHEMVCFVYNANILGYIDLKQFLIAKLKLDPKNLVENLNLISVDENLHYSFLLLAITCNEPVSYQKLADHLFHLSCDISNQTGRETVIHCLEFCLPLYIKQNQTHTFNLNRVFLQLFKSLFNLIQDDETSIRNQAAKLILNLSPIEENKKISKHLKLNKAVSLLVSALDFDEVPSLLFELVVDLYFEAINRNEESDCDYDEFLFDKCKPHEFSNNNLLIQFLITQLKQRLFPKESFLENLPLAEQIETISNKMKQTTDLTEKIEQKLKHFLM
ncbi:hypothetical protein RDWZM_005689 [Blomia tropicalis]|uniref:Uncharacterized protein n=1 Tax=Blomia tropicalis TaxID=40697 RepID=A0A9Q0M6I5_BLOTA|nr:hypothetical protein RDWZM_005689 [Blomia tropicalis]